MLIFSPKAAGLRYGRRIRKGAVPLGQHSHKPDDVMPLPPGVAVEVAQPPPRFAYPDLPAPAAPALGCCRCEAKAALVEPSTNRGFCSEHWMSCVVCSQLD